MSPSTLELPLDDALDGLLASRPDAIADPYPVWNHVREQDPVHRHGPVVLVTRYDDVKRVIRDGESFSNLARKTGSRVDALRSGLNELQAQAWQELSDFESLYLSRSDGEDHERRRRITHQAFTPRRIAELDTITRRYTNEMLDTAPRPETDIMDALAYRLPLMVICDMLGVPPDDRERIHDWSNALGSNRGGDSPEVLMRAHTAMLEFRAYVNGLLERLRHERGTDLLSALIGAEDEERLNQDELAAMFVVLLFAGHETTTNLIANGLLMLLRDRTVWQALCEDPSLIPNAVEELLRVVTPVQWLFRVTTRPVTLGDVSLDAGQTVYALLAAANRDPDVFERPDEIDVRRSNARQHLALGFGGHFCLGNALARMEGAAAFDLLTRRFPDIELITEHPLWRGNAQLRSISELPVRLGPDRGAA
jgi:cytochrome P450